MDEDLDILGAEGLSGQFITLRVKGIDKGKLGQALGGGAKGAVVGPALALVDLAPQQTLSMLMPLVQDKVRSGYGVDLEYQITEAPPQKGEKAGGGKSLLVGLLLGAGGVWAASHFGVVGMARGVGGNLLHKVGL